MKSLKDVWKDYYKIIIPIIHFCISFIWEKYIFHGFGNWEYYMPAIRNENVISNTG
jgi:hypothetical protein